MKRKFLKGFTLVELIVVMAILAVLMAAIMQMFKPIRETFVDSTTYENQRSVQTGMAKYITESIRFSTDIGFYSKGSGASNPSDAVKKFADAYAVANGFDASDPRYDEVLKKTEVIVIDRDEKNNWNAEHNGGHGRILRRKINGDTLHDDPNTSNVPSKEWRLALGTQYYGDKNDYSIKLKKIKPSDADTALDSGDAGDGIKVTITCEVINLSMLTRTASPSGGAVITPFAISNNATVICPNLVGSSVGNNTKAGVKSAGIFETSGYTNETTTAYIVFLTEKI